MKRYLKMFDVLQLAGISQICHDILRLTLTFTDQHIKLLKGLETGVTKVNNLTDQVFELQEVLGYFDVSVFWSSTKNMSYCQCQTCILCAQAHPELVTQLFDCPAMNESHLCAGVLGNHRVLPRQAVMATLSAP